MTREEKIERLVNESMEKIQWNLTHGDGWLLSEYLTHGFAGFNAMSDEELDIEISEVFNEEAA